MSAYAELDPVIEAWVRRTGSTLFHEWAGQPARFFHLPAEAPFECFQVSIQTPVMGRVTVLARSIDTNDGAEMERLLEGLSSGLNAILAEAVAVIEAWKHRPRENGAPS